MKNFFKIQVQNKNLLHLLKKNNLNNYLINKVIQLKKEKNYKHLNIDNFYKHKIQILNHKILWLNKYYNKEKKREKIHIIHTKFKHPI